MSNTTSSTPKPTVPAVRIIADQKGLRVTAKLVPVKKIGANTVRVG